VPEVLVVLSVPVAIAVMAVTFVVFIGLMTDARPLPAEQTATAGDG
jgi:hypothetical protein